MFLTAVIAGLFAGFAPFWGLLFLVAYGYKYFQEDSIRYFGIFAGMAAVSVFFVNGHYVPLSLFDAFIGVGGVSYFFLSNKTKGKRLSWTLLYTSILSAVLGIVRTFLFGATLKQQSIEGSKAMRELVLDIFADNEEFLSIAAQSIEQSSRFAENYSAAIWFITMISALYIAIFWQTTRLKGLDRLSDFTLPYWVVYPLIISMAVFIIPSLKTFGANLLIMVMPLMLFQGLAVSQTYIKKTMPERNANWFSFLMLVILNYIYISFLVITGILDIWMHFRDRIGDNSNENNN